jgi:hypothetical protein
MGLLGSLVMRYAAEGHQEVIRADKRVRDSLSETARNAKRDEGVTKGWMQRHMTALLAVAGTIGAAMYTIARESPSMSAAIGEIRLAFSLFFMDVGERAAPFFEDLAGKAWWLLKEWEKLPDSMKDALVRGTPAILENWDQLLLDLAAGVDAFFGTGDTFQKITQALIDEWERFRENPIAWGKEFVEKLRQGIQNVVPTLHHFISLTLGKIGTTFLNWLPDAKTWGQDMLQKFIDGLRSMYGLLSSTLAEIKRRVEDALSFDIARNDRMAFRWGADMIQHFEAGMQSVPFAPMLPVGAPTPTAMGAGGGGSQTISIDVGGITIAGADVAGGGLDEGKIARMVRDEIGQALRERTR